MSGRLPKVDCAPVALALAGPVQSIDVGDLDIENALDRAADFDLVGIGRHHEDVDAFFAEGVRLFGDDGPDDDVPGVIHRACSSIPVRFGSGSQPRRHPRCRLLGCRLVGCRPQQMAVSQSRQPRRRQPQRRLSLVRRRLGRLASRRPAVVAVSGRSRSARPVGPRRRPPRPSPQFGGAGGGLSPCAVARQCGSRKHDPVRAQHVVGIELGDEDQVDPGEVTEGLVSPFVLTRQDQEHSPGKARAWRGPPRRPLVLGTSQSQLSTTATWPPAGPVRQSSPQGELDHLAWRALRIAARFGPQGHATAGVMRRTRAPLAGPAGALLPVRLGPAAGDLGPGLGALGPGAGRRQLSRDDLVHQRDVGLHAEHGRVELDGRRDDPVL